jgi:hypothetical protein
MKGYRVFRKADGSHASGIEIEKELKFNNKARLKVASSSSTPVPRRSALSQEMGRLAAGSASG